MRALFTLLFGASLLLFTDAAQRKHANADLIQARRLGYLHYVLLWWGDILFPYALCGLMALALRRLPPRLLVMTGLSLFFVSHGLNALGDVIGMASEQRVLAGHGSPAEIAEQADMMQRIASSMADDTRVLDAGFVEALRLRLTLAPFLPFATFLNTLTETLPLMLVGMALHRTGFFIGGWSARRLALIALAGIAGGMAIMLALLQWIWAHHFPPRAMFGIMAALSAPEHLAMALGYGAALRGGPGARCRVRARQQFGTREPKSAIPDTTPSRPFRFEPRER